MRAYNLPIYNSALVSESSPFLCLPLKPLLQPRPHLLRRLLWLLIHHKVIRIRYLDAPHRLCVLSERTPDIVDGESTAQIPRGKDEERAVEERRRGRAREWVDGGSEVVLEVKGRTGAILHIRELTCS